MSDKLLRVHNLHPVTMIPHVVFDQVFGPCSPCTWACTDQYCTACSLLAAAHTASALRSFLLSHCENTASSVCLSERTSLLRSAFLLKLHRGTAKCMLPKSAPSFRTGELCGVSPSSLQLHSEAPGLPQATLPQSRTLSQCPTLE